jgi:hypothetical protein
VKVDEVEVGLGVGTVQADDHVIGMRCVHGCVWFERFTGLPRA